MLSFAWIPLVIAAALTVIAAVRLHRSWQTQSQQDEVVRYEDWQQGIPPGFAEKPGRRVPAWNEREGAGPVETRPQRQLGALQEVGIDKPVEAIHKDENLYDYRNTNIDLDRSFAMSN